MNNTVNNYIKEIARLKKLRADFKKERPGYEDLEIDDLFEEIYGNDVSRLDDMYYELSQKERDFVYKRLGYTFYNS